MKAIVVPSPGGYDKLVVTEMSDPKPGRGEVLLDVAFAGCNWGDTQVRSGTYSYPVKYPIIPGYEVAGTVAELGSNVTGVNPGERVAALLASGGYAQKCVASSRMLIALPKDIVFATAAAFPIQALTAYHMLFTVFHLKRGDTVLVHAIGGGVGLYCTQLAVQGGRASDRHGRHAGKGEAAAHLRRREGRGRRKRGLCRCGARYQRRQGC